MALKQLLQLRTLLAGIFCRKTYINLWKFDFVIPHRNQQNSFDDDSRPGNYYNRAFIEDNKRDGHNKLIKKLIKKFAI